MTVENKIAKSLSVDFILNIAATLISTGAMQLVLYPRLAASLGGTEYGVMLTIMGAVNVITLAFGNNLAQLRLIKELDYERLRKVGDFQILLIVSCGLSSFCTVVVCLIMGVPVAELFSIVILSISTVLKSYYLVAFRIKVDYRSNLIANIYILIGYVVGSFVLLGLFHWSWAFTLANVICIAYICSKTRIAFEPFRVTELHTETIKSYIMLISGGILGNLSTYLDRFVIFPILGAGSVSSFYVATYFSKAFSLAFLPITSVVLSYLTQGKIKITKRLYCCVNIAIAAASIGLVVVCLTIGSWFTELLFPDLYAEAMPYILLGTIGVVINIASSFNGTIVLAIASPVWQTIIPGISTGVYLALAIALSSNYGLYGACVAVIVANSLRFGINFVVGAMVSFRRS